MKYIISTLGCKVNQYETQAMETILQSHGHECAGKGETADAIIVNTCAVTAESGHKSRQVIRRLANENPGAVIAVSGCYSQLEPEKVKELGASVIFGTGDRLKLVEAVEKAVESGEGEYNIDKPFQRRQFEELPAGAMSGRTRAMLKIQDGCVNFCSYCIIPYTRGRLRSLSLETAAAEAARLAAQGYKEIVLTGIEVASYGVDLPGKPDLADVVCAVAKAAPELRLRMGSIEPTVITDEFCQRLAANANMCRHFHLSLQSGCDKTLKNMNRKYDTEFFFGVTERLRRYFPGCALTTDLITGFPGETDEDQTETLVFIKRCGFADMHIFPYSRRPGTPADKMPAQCSNAVKSARAAQAQQAANEMHADFLGSCVGLTLPVLFETEVEGFSIGHSDTYMPVKAAATGLHGMVKNVEITAVEGDILIGNVN